MIVPIGIPGMGKSHFAANYLEKSTKMFDEKSSFQVISYDSIRKNCFDKWQ